MNMIDIQDKLKGLSEQQLVSEMQSPTGTAPQFLVLSEITRRKRMRDSFQNQQSQPNTSIAEEAIASAGVPGGGIASMARSLAPNSSIAQNTAAMPSQPMPEEQPVQVMYGGGYVQKMAGGMSVGGQSADMSNPMVAAWVRAEAQRRGVPVEQVLASLGPTGSALVRQSQIKGDRNRMLGLEPTGDGMTFPTQADLNSKFFEGQVGINTRPMTPQPIDTLPEIFPPAPREGRVIGSQPPAFPSPSAPQMAAPVDLDLTAPTMSSPVAPRQQDMRLMGLEPQGESSPRVNEILDQLEYGFAPGSDRRMTAAEMLSQSAGPQAPLPAAPASPAPSAKEEGPTTRLSIDPYTGKFVNAPTIGQQITNVGNAASDAMGYVMDTLPTFDMSGGDPYSELTEEEMSALTSGRMSPETADALQSSRLSMAQYSRGSEAANPPAAAPAGDQPKPPLPTKDGNPQGGGISTDTAGVSATPDSSTSVTGRGAGAAVGGSNAPTSYEQELRDAMARAEKRANQDKWLALAQVGMQLMSSKEPTLGGALGEAGIAGLQAYRGSRDAYENERLGLTKSLYDLQQQQAAAAAAQRAAGAKAVGKPLTPDQRLKQIEDRLKFLVQGDPITGETIMPGADGAVAALRQEYVNLINGTGGSTFDATAQ